MVRRDKLESTFMIDKKGEKYTIIGRPYVEENILNKLLTKVRRYISFSIQQKDEW